jgi:hypothetical protein
MRERKHPEAEADGYARFQVFLPEAQPRVEQKRNKISQTTRDPASAGAAAFGTPE